MFVRVKSKQESMELVTSPGGSIRNPPKLSDHVRVINSIYC